MSRKPTMSDIAAACGVSQATVSLVLNKAPGTRISAATREAVTAKARELGYRRGGRSAERKPLVAMLINEVVSTPHAAALIQGVAEASEELGLLSAVMTVAQEDDATFDQLAAAGVRGVIYARLVTQEVAPPARLGDWPAVLLNCQAPKAPFPSIVPGDLAAGQTATLALLDAGHRRIAFVGGEDALWATRERLKGYRRALAMRDVPADPALVVMESWSLAGGYAALRRLAQLREPPTAAFCFCDRAAAGVYDAARELGLRIPEDLSIIGFDNEVFTADLRPPLTTMELPHAEMARHAVEELARLMAGPNRPPRVARLKFDCPLVPRASVAPPPAGRMAREGALEARG